MALIFQVDLMDAALMNEGADSVVVRFVVHDVHCHPSSRYRDDSAVDFCRGMFCKGRALPKIM